MDAFAERSQVAGRIHDEDGAADGAAAEERRRSAALQRFFYEFQLLPCCRAAAKALASVE